MCRTFSYQLEISSVKMFFSISKKKQKNYTFSYKLGNTFLNLDAGWTKFDLGHKQLFFKGYVLGEKITKLIPKLANDPTPKAKGNFCCVVSDGKKLILTHDVHRSFPLYLHKDQITNLRIGEFIGSNVYLTIQNKFEIKKNRFVKIDSYGWVSNGIIALSQECFRFIQHAKLVEISDLENQYF